VRRRLFTIHNKETTKSRFFVFLFWVDEHIFLSQLKMIFQQHHIITASLLIIYIVVLVAVAVDHDDDLVIQSCVQYLSFYVS
jgi:hypothetical protein